MAGNDFLAWAIGGGANVPSQASYASDPALGPGVATGVARSDLYNKSLRQGTSIAQMIGDFIVAQLAADVVDNGNIAALEAQFEAAILQLVGAVSSPTGAIILWPVLTIPAGYLECNGLPVLNISYPDLFAVIGTTYGTTGAGNFRLPDYRGYFVRGFDHGTGRDPGRVLPSLQAGAVQAHTHTFKYSSDNSGAGAPGHGGNLANSYTTDLTGGTETRPINQTALYLIKT